MINPYFIGVGCGVLYFLAADDPALRHLGMLLFVPAATLLYALVQKQIDRVRRDAAARAAGDIIARAALAGHPDTPEPELPAPDQ